MLRMVPLPRALRRGGKRTGAAPILPREANAKRGRGTARRAVEGAATRVGGWPRWRLPGQGAPVRTMTSRRRALVARDVSAILLPAQANSFPIRRAFGR